MDELLIPKELLPADGRFGCGPAKVRPEALRALSERSDIMGTSHRQAPVRNVVQHVQEMLADLYRLPDGYQVLLGNGGATLFWDQAVFSLVRERSAHGVYGEFSKKFYDESKGAPFLGEPVLERAEPGSVVLPTAHEGVDVYGWAQNETSTGAAAPVRRVAGADDGALVVIDATSAAGTWTPTSARPTPTTSPRRRTSRPTVGCGSPSPARQPGPRRGDRGIRPLDPSL